MTKYHIVNNMKCNKKRNDAISKCDTSKNGNLAETLNRKLTDKTGVNQQTIALGQMTDKIGLMLIFGLIIYIISITVFHVIIIGYCVIPLGGFLVDKIEILGKSNIKVDKHNRYVRTK